MAQIFMKTIIYLSAEQNTKKAHVIKMKCHIFCCLVYVYQLEKLRRKQI